MRNVLLIIKHEIKTTLAKRSFWITTFLLPGVIIVLSMGSQALSLSAVAQDGSNQLFGTPSTANLPVGYVDEAGLIKDIPDQIPAGVKWKATRLRAYPDEAAAKAALEAGKIGKYYLVPANFMATGNLTLVDSQFSFFNSLDNNDYFEYVIQLNLANNPNIARALLDPTPQISRISLAPLPTSNANKDDGAAFLVPFAALFIFFFVITMTSGFMLQSVSAEKENRTVEVLLLSLGPRDLMLGKILGLGVVALLQVAIWLGGGLLVMNGTSLGSNVTLPAGFFVWAVLYFVFGFLLYASILGAIGALAPSAREGAQFTFPALLPLMIPLWLSNVLIESPNDGISIFFSLFPLTSPTSMLTRLAAAPVPFEQLLIGLLLLAATAYLVILLAARFFRADTLLSMSSLNLKRVVQQLRG
jgi:ABC-2 type transport system permease protein